MSNHTLPRGVEQAEALAILEEDRAREMAVLAELCAHDQLSVLRSIGSTFDDHETIYGRCQDCGALVVSTLQFGGGGHIDTRPMTDAERERYS